MGKEQRTYNIIPLKPVVFESEINGKQVGKNLRHENPNVFNFLNPSKKPRMVDQLYTLGGVITYGYIRHQASEQNAVPEKIKKKSVKEYQREFMLSVSRRGGSYSAFEAETDNKLSLLQTEEPDLWKVLEGVSRISPKKNSLAMFQGAADVYFLFKKHMETQEVRRMYEKVVE